MCTFQRSRKWAVDFSAFSGLLTIPGTTAPYAGGVIPSNQLSNVFAWRIGPTEAPSANGGWSPTGSMTQQRTEHATARLPNGQVLVVGSDNTCEIYDPAAGTFSPTGQTLFTHGNMLTATLLSNGRVLIVGGTVSPSAAELYDPLSGAFVTTGLPVQPHGYFHSATLLNDGRVLIVGELVNAGTGGLATDTNAGAETYDPQTGTFAEAGAMASNRNLHTATLLADGQVLIAGGYAKGAAAPDSTKFDTAELFNPSSGGFLLTGSMEEPRAAHFAALLPNGTALLGGGDFNDPTAEIVRSDDRHIHTNRQHE